MTNNRNLQTWIRDSELRRNQIIAISTNETDIENGDNIITIFYRTQSIQADAMPLDNIQFEQFSTNMPWERQLKSANDFKVDGRTAETLAITRTPKNIGAARCQTAWYTSEAGNPDTHTSILNRADGNMEGLASQV